MNDGTGHHNVKQNEQDSERQMSHFISYAETILFKEPGIVVPIYNPRSQKAEVG
jgi:hypothetical protein